MAEKYLNDSGLSYLWLKLKDYFATDADIIAAIANKQDTITFNTAYNAETNKAATMTDITNAVAGISGISFQVVTTLPTTGQSNIIYLVPLESTTTQNNYAEYIYVNNSWEKIGETGTIDLTDYLKKTDITFITNEEIDTIVGG